MRYRFSRSLIAAVVAASFALPAAASAQLLFDTGTGSSGVIGGGASGFGIGQGVAVTTATHLTQFGFYELFPGGNGFKFFIFDQTNSNLLFSSVVNPVVVEKIWLESGSLDLDLAAGTTYFFGIINSGRDTAFGLGATLSAGPHSENGLTLTGDATSYTNYSTPTLAQSPQYNLPPSLSLRLEGTQGATTTPEPSSMALLGTGLVGLVPMVRRRRR